MRSALALAHFALTLGCSRGSPEACQTWTAPEAGTCRARAWVLSDEGIGTPGARLRALSMDGFGLGVAVWEVALPGRAAVEVGEELSPGVWAERDPAARLGGTDSAPAVAGGADGSAVVTWVHAGAGAGVVVSERDPWGAWRDPAPGEVLSSPPSAVEPWVAAAPSGEQILAWCQSTRTGWGVALARRAGAGAAWERPGGAEDVVSPDILFANQPQIAVNARGDALVAWYQSEGAPLMTYVSERRGPGGRFSRAGVREHLSARGAPVDSDAVANPKPALGSEGEAAVVWTQENGAGATPLYLATRDAGGAWIKPRDLEDAFSPATGVARTARAAFGPGGELYVVWAQGEKGGPAAIYAARRGRDGRWTGPPVQLSSPQRGAYGPTLAVGPEGGAVAAWVESWGPRDDRVVARRTGGDRAAWEAVETLSRPETPPAGAPAAAMGPGDRALVGWSAGAPRSTRVVFASVE